MSLMVKNFGEAEEVQGLQDWLSTYKRPECTPFLYEALLPELPRFIRSLTRRKLDAIVANELGLENEVPTGMFHRIRYAFNVVLGKKKKVSPDFSDLPKEDKQALGIFFDPQVLRAHHDVGTDYTLSSDEVSITHFDTQSAIIAHTIQRVAAKELPPEALQRTGCIFLDVNGTKSIIDCTNHRTAGNYLKAMAALLVNLPEPLQLWLNERNLTCSAHSVAGDEFVLLLRSTTDPLDQGSLDEFGTMVKATISKSEILKSFIDFKNPKVLMKFAGWPLAKRKAYYQEGDKYADELAVIASSIPSEFTPSVSAGSSTLVEALQKVQETNGDTAENVNITETGKDVYATMVELADKRLLEIKPKERELLSKEELYFLTRGKEMRGVMATVDQLRGRVRKVLDIARAEKQRIKKLMEEIAEVRKENSELRKKSDADEKEKLRLRAHIEQLQQELDERNGIRID